MYVENTELHWQPLCSAAPAFNLHFLPCLPQLFSFKNMGLQEPPSHQRAVRKTLREFLMKYDMPDKPGLLEACYFEVFPSAVLPLNKTWCWNQIMCSTLDSPAEIRTPHMCWPIFAIINLFRKCWSRSSHGCCLILCKNTRSCVHWERERERLICISKWCVCLLAKVFLHA